MTTFDPLTRNSHGGRWSPTPPIDGIHPILDEVSPEDLEADWLEAARFVSRRVQIEAAGQQHVERGYWFTDLDPEWCADLFAEAGLHTVPPVVVPLIEVTRGMLGCTRLMAACQVLGMDTAPMVAHQIVAALLPHRRPFGDVMPRGDIMATPGTEVDEPFLEIAFGLPEYLHDGITDMMRVNFAEKYLIEARTVERQQPGGDLEGTPWGLRPVKILEFLTGLAPEVIACVPTPDMGEDPQGHSCFWEWLERRAKRYVNGTGADLLVDGLGRFGGLIRVFDGVHTVRSATRGQYIADRLANRSDPWWDRIAAAKAAGWPTLPV